MTLGTSIRIFLADGTPDGLRLVEKANWTGLALVGPRSIYPDVRTREEFDRPGVYVLRGSTEDSPTRPKLYIGEADSVRVRIDNHLKHKDWWDDFVVFTSKDENLNKAYIRHLEARLVAVATRQKRAHLDNATAPQGPRLSEADAADAEGFLANMLLIYPLLGINAFEEPLREAARVSDRPLLSLKGRSAEAMGRDLPEGFIVYRGSVARPDEVDSINPNLIAYRRQLLDDGVLASHANGLRLEQDYTFGSPSAAASVFLGRNTNGRIAWVTEDGRTLKEIQEASLPDTEDESTS